MVARTWSSSRFSSGERLLLRCDRNAANSFPNTQGKDQTSRVRRRKRVPLDVGGTLVLRFEWRRLCRGLLELQQVCEGPLEFLDVRCDYPRDASAEMGLISPGRENLLDFLELWQVLSSYDGDLRDLLWWPQ